MIRQRPGAMAGGLIRAGASTLTAVNLSFGAYLGLLTLAGVRRPGVPPPGNRATRFVILVPAHNEATIIADALRSGSSVYLDDVRALVEEAQRDGAIPDADPRLLALGVLGAVSSFSNAWRSGNIDLDTESLATFVGDWITRALR